MNHTPCHRNKVNRLKETESECAALGDREGKWRRRSGKVLPKNTFLIALRSAIEAQKEINTLYPQFKLTLLKNVASVFFVFCFLNQSANMTVYLTPREQGRDLDNKTGRDREAYG